MPPKRYRRYTIKRVTTSDDDDSSSVSILGTKKYVRNRPRAEEAVDDDDDDETVVSEDVDDESRDDDDDDEISDDDDDESSDDDDDDEDPDIRHRLVLIARLAEETHRFDDMAEAMNSVAKLGVELTAEERNLLSVGYTNLLGAKRASWRILSVIKSKEEANGEMQHVALAKESLKRVEDELTSKCNEILLTIDDYLLPSSGTGEAAVFYHKMKGDYYRYLAECKSDAEKEAATSQSLKAYEAATAIAETDLPPTNPIRLGLALNFSVFYYEIIAKTERACNMAKQAFDDTASELDSLDKKSFQDSALIMRSIGDNLTLWSLDPAEDEAAEDKAAGEQNKAVDGVSGENLKDVENKTVDGVSGENLKDVENKAGDEEL